MINIINAHAEEAAHEASQPLVADVITQQPAAEAGLGENPGVIPIEVQETNQDSSPVQIRVENPGESQEADPAEILGENPTEIQEEIQAEAPAEEPTGNEKMTTQEETKTSENRTRSGRRVKRPERFVAVTKVSRSEWHEKACELAIKLELTQLFNDLKALRIVKRAQIAKGTKVLKSHMFLVRKYLANGAFDKVKARLVADGRDQDPLLYPNKSSPTVAIHSVFTVLGLAATKRWRIVVKIDVKGAFVQTPMSGEPMWNWIQKLQSMR